MEETGIENGKQGRGSPCNSSITEGTGGSKKRLAASLKGAKVAGQLRKDPRSKTKNRRVEVLAHLANDHLAVTKLTDSAPAPLVKILQDRTYDPLVLRKSTEGHYETPLELDNWINSLHDEAYYSADSLASVSNPPTPLEYTIPHVHMSVEGKRVTVALDTGATISIMDQAKFRELQNTRHIPFTRSRATIRAANGETMHPIGLASMNIQLNGAYRKVQVHIMKDFMFDLIGWPQMNLWQATISTPKKHSCYGRRNLPRLV